MKSLRWGASLCVVAVLVGALNTACSRHYVIVPEPEDGYTPTDTLYGYLNGDEIRVTFWFDTIMRVDTVVRLDTLWEAGERTILRVDTLTLADTVFRVDTVRVLTAATVARTDTVVRTDTVIRTNTVAQTDTVVRTDTVVHTDTVVQTETVIRTDTVFRADTVRVTVTDTVRVAGQRMLFVPPGHYPPEGQCRVWMHDQPPGRQAAAAPCSALGDVPAGAFILFGGEAWDFDYDWLGEAARDPAAVPPEIVALKRRN